MRVQDVLDIPVILPGYSSREPSLREMILRYYETAGGGILGDRAGSFAKLYIEQLHAVEEECFGVHND